ncbi:CBASS cGAMP-activated phospholipase [Methylobacterium goesingense]|uniref:PNPLA domain-containing protein n=1 Tax=Methylobacterium goesingense TaxID=243690 RepID=A0ABV2L8M9_9HYPH|nr:CBASS cGAMP-activated phospholipase [Methylobacterium goesingense]GJD76525.1 hypothetical protein CFIICLFH_4783 [Methylobacterium goesingense]
MSETNIFAPTAEDRPYRVLSLDGGGMRGTYTATYLAKLCETYGKRRGGGALDLGAAFDLITGTSTGGIIACALAKGVPLGDVIQLYRDHGAGIFPRRLPDGLPRLPGDLLRRPAAIASGAEVLRGALAKQLEATTVGQIWAERRIALSIPAVEMSQHRAWVFKTPHLPDSNHRDDATSLVDVCMATTAAPVFRSMSEVEYEDDAGKGRRVFVDGGLWANNPVLVGLIDALDMTRPGQEIEVFCLGTCPTPAGERIGSNELDRGLLEWRFGGKAAELSIDAQQFAYDHMAMKIARHVGRRCSIIRFPSQKVPATLLPFLELDDTRAEAMDALMDQARTDADMTNSKCAYRATDTEAELICRLFETAPLRAAGRPVTES